MIAKFKSLALRLGHPVGDSSYCRSLINFLLGRERDSTQSLTDKEWRRAFGLLSYYRIKYQDFKQAINGELCPRTEFMKGFEEEWKKEHPGQPLPEDVFFWMRVSRLAPQKAEIDYWLSQQKDRPGIKFDRRAIEREVVEKVGRITPE